MRLIGKSLVAAVALLGSAAFALGASAQEIKQMQLSDKQIESFIAAQKDFAPLASKLLEGGEKPNDALTAELEGVAKKHGFASFAEYEDVGANISIVLEGLDRQGAVRLGGRGDVHDVRPHFVQHLEVVIVRRGDAEPRARLPGEIEMPVADCDNPRARQLRELLQVRIGDLAAADQGDLQCPLCRVH